MHLKFFVLVCFTNPTIRYCVWCLSTSGPYTFVNERVCYTFLMIRFQYSAWSYVAIIKCMIEWKANIIIFCGCCVCGFKLKIIFMSQLLVLRTKSFMIIYLFVFCLSICQKRKKSKRKKNTMRNDWLNLIYSNGI